MTHFFKATVEGLHDPEIERDICIMSSEFNEAEWNIQI